MVNLVDVYFDTKKVNEDVTNLLDLEIEVNFEDESGQGTIKSGSLEFVGELADKINKWNFQGLYGGAGIFEAPPLRLEACGKAIFDGGINTADCSTSYECDKVVAPLRTQAIDLLNDRANSFRFEYLTTLKAGTNGSITQSDYVLVPYVINSIPDYFSVMITGLSLFTLISELKKVIFQIDTTIKDLIGHVKAAIAAFIPPVTFVGVGMAIGFVLVDLVKIILLIAYIIFIIRSIVELFKMIFDNIIQRIKYKKGMRVITSFRKACDYLGFGFSSTLLNSAPHNNEVIIPRKIARFADKKINLTTVFGFQQQNKDRDDNENPKSMGVFDGTFADLILLYEDRFNAEVRIIDNTLHFETKDYWARFSNYTLPNIKTAPNTTNACELTANYHIIHALDDSETNTYDEYEGTEAYMALSPIVISNKKNLLLKGLTDKRLNIALAKRKINLTPVEKLFNNIYESISSLFGGSNTILSVLIGTIKKQLDAISVIPGLKPITEKINLLLFPANPLGVRIGMMLLSSDFTGVQKVLIIDSTNRLVSNNNYLTSAKYLMDKFHFTNFAVRIIDSDKKVKNDHNQWLIYTDKEVPFCCEDYKKVLNNNYCKTYDQKTAKIKSLIWNPYKNIARITYRVKEQYTKNLTNTYFIDGQQ